MNQVEALPPGRTADALERQLLRSGSSVGATCRAACQGRSATDVLARSGVVEEQSDESDYWMELLVEAGLVPEKRASDLKQETPNPVAMTVASIKTLRHCASLGARPQSKIQNPKSKMERSKMDDSPAN